jgi:ADP-ribosylglycohydrolase
MIPGEGGRYEITDDTQMTLFTAEGLLRAWATARHTGNVPDFSAAVKCSYLSWLKTQGESENSSLWETHLQGWILKVEGLHRRRAPGTTCLTALRESSCGEKSIITNTSKGCGGVSYHKLSLRCV